MRCGQCGRQLTYLDVVDGKDCGGMPDIKYHECLSCGWMRAITKRPKRERLPKPAKDTEPRRTQ